jgi:TonB family protein
MTALNLLRFACLFGYCVFSSAGAGTDSPTLVYQQQLTEIIIKNVVPELAKYPQKLDKGTVKLTIEVDSTGKVTGLEVISSSANQLVEQICGQVIRSIRFPRVPRSVLVDLGQDFVQMRTEINIGE